MTLAEWRQKCHEEFIAKVESGEIARRSARMAAGHYYTLDATFPGGFWPGPAIDQDDHWRESEETDAAGRDQLDIERLVATMLATKRLNIEFSA